MASPANRRRAQRSGHRSGHRGRIGSRRAHPAQRFGACEALARGERTGCRGADITEIKVIGLRRLIAERMSEAKRNIPHFAYVEEVDVTELESLRVHLNLSRPQGAGCVELSAAGGDGADSSDRIVSAMQRALRCAARGAGSPPRRACRHCHANPRRIEGSGGAQRARAGVVGGRRGNSPACRARAHATRRPARNWPDPPSR